MTGEMTVAAEPTSSSSSSVDDVDVDASSRSTCVNRHVTPSLLKRLRVTFSFFLLLFSAFLGSIFMAGPILVLAYVVPKLYRRTMDWLILTWFRYAEVIIVKLMSVRVRQFGDHFRPLYDNDVTECNSMDQQENGGERVPPNARRRRFSLVLLNHPTELDWFFIWALGDNVQRAKIILKESLSYVPGAGWAMQLAGFIFLRRSLEVDRERIRHKINYFTRLGTNVQLLLFPEGTNLSRNSLSRSNEFADKHHLPLTRYTLHPRISGMRELTKMITKDNLIEVYDVTVAYPFYSPANISEVLLGKMPEEVHYYVKRYPATVLFGDDQHQITADANTAGDEWIRNRWAEKESLLEQYYKMAPQERLFSGEIQPKSLMFLNSRKIVPCQTWLGLVNTIMWTVSLILFVYLLYAFKFARLFAVIIPLTYIGLHCFYGGLTEWSANWV